MKCSLINTSNVIFTKHLLDDLISNRYIDIKHKLKWYLNFFLQNQLIMCKLFDRNHFKNLIKLKRILKINDKK